MHTYRKQGKGWEVVFQHTNSLDALGPTLGPRFGTEYEAAAYASFLNGGRFSPGEIEPIFPKEFPPVEAEDRSQDYTFSGYPATADDSTHPDRPASLDDYPLERTARK